MADGCEQSGSVVPLTVSRPEPVRASRPVRVLISEPQLRSYGLPYLPVMWGILKTYWESHGSGAEHVNWLAPIHRMDPPADSLAGALDDGPIDVLGLSCYTWNWRLQTEIASLVKSRHPSCLVIVGGPHPDYSDPSFFDRHPAIDAVVVKDGEIPFARLLQRVLSHSDVDAFRRSGGEMSDIPGLCLPSTGGGLTSEPQLPTAFETSHYLAQESFYASFLRDHPEGVVAAWETNRGCPFRCSYCDWGSNTMSKMRTFGMDRLRDEIDWFARSGVRVIFSVDSNWGMFKRDLALTESIVAAKERWGHPAYFAYSNAKNVPDRTVAISRAVIGAGLETAHTLSIQHSSEAVLEATDRENISVEKQIEVVRALRADGVPISVQLILGLPGDTPALWRRTFTDLMEWGIHDGYVVTSYHLLPNAPAARPAYRSEWGIETVDRYVYDGPGVRMDEPVDPLTYARADLIVATSSFDRDDWLVMARESACVRALHNGGLTQLVSRMLRASHGVGYDRFYGLMLGRVLPEMAGDLLSCLDELHREFLEDETSLALLPMPGAASTGMVVEPFRWLYASLVGRLAALEPALISALRDELGDLDGVVSACQYQRAIAVTPRYDREAGLSFESDRDWPAYFAGLDEDPTAVGVPLPQQAGRLRVVVSDREWSDGSGSGPLAWDVGDGPRSWRRWFEQIATNRMSLAKSTFSGVGLESVPVAETLAGR